MKKAEVGQIWKCIKECPTNYIKGARRVIIEKDELVEFRYWSPPNFRTTEDKYYSVEEKDFYYHFEYVGSILPEIRNRNRNTLKEILDDKLYDLKKE
jgi:hypothetical protein